jgi:hypothetical protein
VEVSQIINERLRADLTVTSKSGRKHIIEIIEDDLMHYSVADEDHPKLRARGRLAEEAAKREGYHGYSSLSYIELD